MTIRTSAKRWRKALIMDTFLIGGLCYALMIGNPDFERIPVFFMWCLTGIGASFYICFFLLGAGRNLTPAIRAQWDDFWSRNAVSLSRSQAYLLYHVVTDIFTISLLLGNGYTWLPFFMATNFVCSLVVIGRANDKVKSLHPSVLQA